MFETERAEFKDWLYKTKPYFDEVHATPREVANWAISQGFSKVIVKEWQEREDFKRIANEK